MLDLDVQNLNSNYLPFKYVLRKDILSYLCFIFIYLLVCLSSFAGFIDYSFANDTSKATPSIIFPVLAPTSSSRFGNRNHPVFLHVTHHNGVDIAAPEYSHVRAVLEGDVIFAGNYGGYGKLVSIQHNKGYASLYGHLSEIRVNTGQKVKTGTIIGRVGSTGASTGCHLHFEWRKDGIAINPIHVFPYFFKKPEG